MCGTMAGGLLLAALTAFPAAAEELSMEERAKLEQKAKQLNEEAGRFYQKRNLPEAVEQVERALAMRERLYPEQDFPRGHPDLARSLNNLCFLLAALGERGKARPYNERALAMNERLYPEKDFPRGHPDLALTAGAHFLGRRAGRLRRLPRFCACVTGRPGRQ